MSYNVPQEILLPCAMSLILQSRLSNVTQKCIGSNGELPLKAGLHIYGNPENFQGLVISNRPTSALIKFDFVQIHEGFYILSIGKNSKYLGKLCATQNAITINQVSLEIHG